MKWNVSWRKTGWNPDRFNGNYTSTSAICQMSSIHFKKYVWSKDIFYCHHYLTTTTRWLSYARKNKHQIFRWTIFKFIESSIDSFGCPCSGIKHFSKSFEQLSVIDVKAVLSRIRVRSGYIDRTKFKYFLNKILGQSENRYFLIFKSSIMQHHPI